MAVTDEAVTRIRDMIVSGELSPGQRLPPEKELSERLGLSRNSLREAVKGLELIKVLDVRQGDGTYVTGLQPHQLLEVMSFVVDLHHDRSIIELFEVRRVLESHAAWRAASVITNEQLEQLQALVTSVGESASVEELVEHDLEFHRLISAASGNDYLTSLLDGLSSSTVRARVWRGITQEGVVARTLEEHRAIVAALTNRDPEMARSWITVHVSGVETWLRSALGEDVTPSADTAG